MSYAQVYIKTLKKKKKPVIKTSEPRTGYSKLLEDYFKVYPSGDIIFKKGTIYKKEEIELIKDLGEKTKKAIHLLKTIFNGEVIECG